MINTSKGTFTNSVSNCILAEPAKTCKGCQQLGDSMRDELTGNPIRTANIFYTINPCEILDKERFDCLLGDFIVSLRLSYEIYGISVHYERTSRLHVHGLITVECTYNGYGGLLAFIQKLAHRYFGRKGLKHEICCLAKWSDDNPMLLGYMNKQNIYEPQHMQFHYGGIY